MNNRPDAGFESYGRAGGREPLLELLAIFFLLAVPNFIYLAAGYEASINELSVLDLVADAAFRIGWCALIPVLLTRRGPFDWKLPRSGREWAKEFGWGLLLILAIIGCDFVIGLIVEAMGVGDPTLLGEPMDARTVAAFLMMTPIIGLNEELVFRVYAQTRLTQVLRSKRFLPVFVAAGVFAALHGYPLVSTIMILVFGLVLGASYQANGKIPRLVVAHTLWNVGVVVLGLL